MLKFKQFNANPKNKKTDDCTTRAIATITGMLWEDVLKIQYEMAIKTKYAIGSKQNDEKVLDQLGFIKMKQPRRNDGTKYLARELDEICPKCRRDKGVIIVVAHHMTSVIGNELIDTWDCGYKTIGNYFIRK